MIVTVTCPACWQPTAVELAGYEGSVEQYEDCQVCCRPMRIRAKLRAGYADYSSSGGDDAPLAGGSSELLSLDVELDG